MSHPKLVIIEGIPGSGKTSTAQAVAEWLGGQGLDARLFLEGNVDHPADFESVACFHTDQLANLRGQFPAWRDALDASAQIAATGEVLLSFGNLADPPAALKLAFAGHDVYNLPERDFMRLTLSRWQSFAVAAAEKEVVYVFECCLLQNQLTTLMAVHDTPPARIRSHLGQIARAIAPLDPRMIYLEPPSIRAALERVAAERPPAWLEFVSAYTCGQAWGAKRRLSGFEGVVAFYEARRDLERALFHDLFPHGLWIERAGQDWPLTTAQVEGFLAQEFRVRNER